MQIPALVCNTHIPQTFPCSLLLLVGSIHSPPAGAEWRSPFLACPLDRQKYSRTRSDGVDTLPTICSTCMTLDLPDSRRNKALERKRALSNCAASILAPAGVPRNTPWSPPCGRMWGLLSLARCTASFPCNWCGAKQNKKEIASLAYPPSPFKCLSYWYYKYCPYHQGVLCGFSIKQKRSAVVFERPHRRSRHPQKRIRHFD
jgi:hypothetical protein